MSPNDSATLRVATLGSGCFWCTEAVFQRVKGVHRVVSGYSGGHDPKPTYKAVCSGETGHAECIQVTYDPAVISYAEVLRIFWKMHDPTTRNRQGNDVGTQYRSVVFYHDEEQQRTAQTLRDELDKARIWPNPIVTEIVAFRQFFPAEDYHQNYYNQNSNQPYCAFVITPKLEKFEEVFREFLR
jgi:peptide-methionine (S)-S-oxide reductase